MLNDEHRNSNRILPRSLSTRFRYAGFTANSHLLTSASKCSGAFAKQLSVAARVGSTTCELSWTLALLEGRKRKANIEQPFAPDSNSFIWGEHGAKKDLWMRLMLRFAKLWLPPSNKWISKRVLLPRTSREFASPMLKPP